MYLKYYSYICIEFKTKVMKTIDNTINPLGCCRQDSFLSLAKKMIPSLREQMVKKAFELTSEGIIPAKRFKNQIEFIRATFPHDEFTTAFNVWEFLRSNNISDRSQVTPEMKMMAENIKFNG